MIPTELARYWPDRLTHLLLKAAFHPDVEVARKAWQRWQDRCDFDKSFWSDLRVALKAFVRLGGLNTNSELEPRLRGLHRYIWSAGQMRIDAARPLLQRLADEAVTLMPIKGSVLLARDPRAISTRFIADLDLLIAPACWERAVDVSLAEGWKSEWNLTRDSAVHRMRQTHHSLSLQRGPQGTVDLHISSLLLNRQRGADEKLWLRVGRGSLCGIPVLLPHPSDQLAIVFGHCFLFRPSKSLDWVDDALATIAAPGFDWGIFVESVCERELAVPSAAALTYMRHRLRLPIPSSPLRAILKQVREPFLTELASVSQSYTTIDEAESRSIYQAECIRSRHFARRALGRVGSPKPAAPIRVQFADVPIGMKIFLPTPTGIGPNDKMQFRLKVKFRRLPTHCSSLVLLRCLDGIPLEVSRFTHAREGGSKAEHKGLIDGAFLLERSIDQLWLIAINAPQKTSLSGTFEAKVVRSSLRNITRRARLLTRHDARRALYRRVAQHLP